MSIFIYKDEAQPTKCTTVFDYDFTSGQVTNSSLISDGWTSIGVNYGLQVASDNSGLQWVNAQTDTPAGIEFAYPDSLVGKRVTWDFEVYVADFDTWGGPKLSLFGSYVAGGDRNKYNNISNIRFAETCGEYNSGWPSYSNMSTGEVYIYGSGGYGGDQASPVYRGSLYGSPNLGLDGTLGIYRMEGYYDFDSWTYYNKWTNPNGATAEWTRTFDNTSDADKAIMESILTSSTKGFAIEITRGYSSRTGQRIRKAKVNVCLVDEEDFYYSDANYQEFQNLVTDIGSVQFSDTGLRFRFNNGVYMGNRIAYDFDGSTMRAIDLDTLTVISSKSSDINGRVRYFGDGKILTRSGIIDTDGNYITQFANTFNSITPGNTGVVRAHIDYDIYKGIVNGNDITFTKIGTSLTDQGVGCMNYGYLGAYLLNGNDTSGGGNSSYINPETDAITNISGGNNSRQAQGFCCADGKMYRYAIRTNYRGRFQKIGTSDEGFVGESLSNSWLARGSRYGKFLGNIVSGGMNTNNGTGNGYGSNNYFVQLDGTMNKVQNNAFPYDTGVESRAGFIDEKGIIYPHTWGGGSGVILKTDKTFTNLNWKNPYLWR